MQIGDFNPRSLLELYFDIEGKPLLNVNYFFGIW